MLESHIDEPKARFLQRCRSEWDKRRDRARATNAKTPQRCRRCAGTGWLRRHDPDSILHLKWMPRKQQAVYRPACPCTIRGLINLDASTLQDTARQAHRQYLKGRAISEIAAAQHCTDGQARMRVEFAAHVLQQPTPDMERVHTPYGISYMLPVRC